MLTNDLKNKTRHVFLDRTHLNFCFIFLTAYELYVNAYPTFSASTYAIDIQCSDAYGSTTKTYTLSVTPNSDPVITGMPLTVTVSETETASSTIHTIAVTDAENHTITCSLVSVPAGPFSINENPATPCKFLVAGFIYENIS